MGLFDNFPYTNFHELNLDAIIKILRDMQDEWAATKDEWADMKEFVNHYFETLDVSEEVSDRIKMMAKDGTLYSIIQPDISSTVTTWLANHISGQTTPAVDRSLTVEGAAAEAYITGNNIRALNEFNTRDLAKLYRHTDRDHSGINFHWTSDGSCKVSGTSVAMAQCFMWDDVNSFPSGFYPGKTLYIDYSRALLQYRRMRPARLSDYA